MRLLQALGILVFILIIGFIGHIDKRIETKLIADQVCQNQDGYTTPTYNQCMANQAENNGDK